jgi:hypothetical protein
LGQATIQPDWLLEGGQRLGRTLPIDPVAIPRIDVEDLGRNRRHAPALPKFARETELHLSLLGGKKIMEALAIFEQKASR